MVMLRLGGMSCVVGCVVSRVGGLPGMGVVYVVRGAKVGEMRVVASHVP